ncbi:MAG TPA: hypothetical protein VF742_17535 [Terracidiphilus sp.]
MEPEPEKGSERTSSEAKRTGTTRECSGPYLGTEPCDYARRVQPDEHWDKWPNRYRRSKWFERDD